MFACLENVSTAFHSEMGSGFHQETIVEKTANKEGWAQGG